MSEQQFDFKGNYLNFLNHGTTTLVPNQFVGNTIMGFGALNGPAIEKGNEFGDCLDGFGVRWEYPASGSGSGVPACDNYVLEDILDWREVVKIPDPSKYDWKKDYEMECRFMGEPNRDTELVDFGFGNGVFERLAALMGFEEALYSIAAEPDEVNALFEKITDYKIQALDYIIDAYHPDTITYYDDVATQKNCFVSPETFRQVIKPHHKRFAQECIKRNVIPIYHCCGKAEDLIEDMIDCGWAAWTSVQPTNDIEKLIQTYGDKIGIIGGFDSTGSPAMEDSSVDDVEKEVIRCIENYGKYHKGYCFFGFLLVNSLDPEKKAKRIGMMIELFLKNAFAYLQQGK
ncbi:MAG: hypothetical protein E7242_09270 [Lachnospiraceae bacterium]|nr:hypothetical protein [Lachnospiraceae bacterium]